jgi:hypothetical protein
MAMAMALLSTQPQACPQHRRQSHPHRLLRVSRQHRRRMNQPAANHVASEAVHVGHAPTERAAAVMPHLHARYEFNRTSSALACGQCWWTRRGRPRTQTRARARQSTRTPACGHLPEASPGGTSAKETGSWCRQEEPYTVAVHLYSFAGRHFALYFYHAYPQALLLNNRAYCACRPCYARRP